MTDALRQYARYAAADAGLPLAFGDDLGDDAIDAAFDVIELGIAEARSMHLWPQPCRCGAQISALCDYHDERHAHVEGGPGGQQWTWHEDEAGRRWDSRSWDAILASRKV